MIRYLPVLLLISLFPAFLSAQLEEVIHDTFDPGDAQTISINLLEEYELLPWAGNQILTETYVEVYGAAPHVLTFFIEEKGRYRIETALSEGQLRLSSADQQRKPIIYRDSECSEYIRTKIYVPDNFEVSGEGELQRKSN